MDTIASSALVVAILYVLSRWIHATLEHAVAHPGNGRPELTWRLTWSIAVVVSALGTASAHVWLLTKTTPGWEVFVFNGIVFGGFLLGFLVSGQDHKARLGL